MTLNDWLDQSGVSPAKFAVLAKVSRATVYRIMGGRLPDAKSALKIEEYTRGIVRLRDMVPPAPTKEE